MYWRKPNMAGIPQWRKFAVIAVRIQQRFSNDSMSHWCKFFGVHMSFFALRKGVVNVGTMVEAHRWAQWERRNWKLGTWYSIRNEHVLWYTEKQITTSHVSPVSGALLQLSLPGILPGGPAHLHFQRSKDFLAQVEACANELVVVMSYWFTL